MKNLICAVTVLAESTAQAATIHVDVNCPGPGNGSIRDPYCSIQTAIDIAVDTDEIVVAPGTYFEAINFGGKAVTLRSSDGAEVTTIDGTGFFHVVQCVTGEGPDTVLDGFTITGGDADGVFPDNRGGGMRNIGSSPTVTNCTFSGNTATEGGGMASRFDSSPTVTNCTFTGNTADFGGGGLHNDEGSSLTVSNSVLWGDSPDEILEDGTLLTVSYSNVQGSWPGIGNIGSNPMFVDPNNGDYRLSPNSPCIDTGDNAAVPKGVLRDLDGNPRFVADACAGDSGSTVDMGAYEFQGTSCDLGTMMERSDILWRNQVTNQTYIWMLDGITPIGNGSPGTFGAVWQIAGVGDFDGDGHSDILWRHISTGEVYIWFIDGTQLANYGPVATIDPTAWVIAGTGDFNNDGYCDILWRHTTGQTYIWLMNGLNRIGQGSPGAANPVLWQVAAIDDFDGDGRTDILWRHTTTGQALIWLIDGTQQIGTGSPGAVNPGAWTLVGTGDFDGDGRSDILWQRTSTGQVVIWLVDGTQRVGSGSPGTVGFEWTIAGIGDFSGDGRSDILWHHQMTGIAYIWFIGGTQNIGGGLVGVAGLDWAIVGAADFDGG